MMYTTYMNHDKPLSEAFAYNPYTGNPVKKTSEHTLEDTLTGQVIYINPRPTVNAILFRENNGATEVLLVERAEEPHKGTWDLPGGFIDLNENLEEALQREIQEELDCAVSDIRYFGSYLNDYAYDGIVYPILDISMVATLEENATLTPNDDVASAKWFPVHAIPTNEVGLASIRNVLLDVMKQYSN